MENILLIGHSHIQCVRRAALKKPIVNLDVVDFRSFKVEDLSNDDVLSYIIDKISLKNFDAIFLCPRGNLHNVLGLLENPKPFSLGDKKSGKVPDAEDNERWFIPYNLMFDHFFARHYSIIKKIVESLDVKFKGTPLYYFPPPPPVSSWEHVLKKPGPFIDKLSLGPSPESLKLKLYEIQLEVLHAIYSEFNIKGLYLDKAVFDDSGFLNPRFYGNDPTHGNTAYGRLILNSMIRFMRN